MHWIGLLAFLPSSAWWRHCCGDNGSPYSNPLSVASYSVLFLVSQHGLSCSVRWHHISALSMSSLSLRVTNLAWLNQTCNCLRNCILTIVALMINPHNRHRPVSKRVKSKSVQFHFIPGSICSSPVRSSHSPFSGPPICRILIVVTSYCLVMCQHAVLSTRKETHCQN